VEKPSVYRIILRYINPNNITISGTISAVPDATNNLDAEQKFEVGPRCLINLEQKRFDGL
jgi:hypothetical protein